MHSVSFTKSIFFIYRGSCVACLGNPSMQQCVKQRLTLFSLHNALIVCSNAFVWNAYYSIDFSAIYCLVVSCFVLALSAHSLFHSVITLHCVQCYLVTFLD